MSIVTEYYKAVRPDLTSHYDGNSQHVVGERFVVPSPDENGVQCGAGAHYSKTLLGAVEMQRWPSEYLVVTDPIDVFYDHPNDYKCRSRGYLVHRILSQREQDAIAGFRLWEANHLFNPLFAPPERLPNAEELLKQWASVSDSVRASVWAYISGLFPNITSWKYIEHLGSDPWRPLLDLWYAGLLPSFDGEVWRLHAGPDALIVAEMRDGNFQWIN